MTTADPGTKPKACFDSRPPECVEQFNRIEKKIDFLTTLMTGNDNPGVGVIVRLDRLEQRWKLTTWVLGLMATAVTIGAVRWIMSIAEHVSETGGPVQ